MSVLALLVAIVVAVRVWGLPRKLTELEEELTRRKGEQAKLQADVQRLRNQLADLREVEFRPPVAAPALVVASPVAAPVAASVVAPPELVLPVVAFVAPLPELVPPALAPTAPPPELAEPAKLFPGLEKVLAEWATPALELVAPEPVALPEVALPTPELVELVPALETQLSESAAELPASVAELPEPTAELPEPAAELPEPATELLEPVAELPEPLISLPEPVRPVPPPAPPLVSPPPRPVPPPPRPPRPAPPVRTGPTWWERAATVLLENWTGILGAVILVTGVGFLGIYAALRLDPPYRFLLVCGFAGAVLGARFALRNKAFARQLNAWLLSSAAAIFLFACVGAVSIPGLQWATPPFDYLLLLAGVSANLYLAWQASREEVATLHGVLSLVALAVLPPTAVTLGAAAGVTAFSIAITYRQLWKYQLLLSIASFFAFHLYWHQELVVIPNNLRLAAMALVILVGGAAAVVQYRSVYARRQFEPLLFTAHLLNWTCLGINLYFYSTGSVWKTIPLALGALLTFWAGRRAKQLGIGWLFQTDTIISLILALATALSLQGWHATPLVIVLFMLLESLLVALVMARQGEALVYRVALAGALLAGTGLLVLAASHAAALPPTLYRDALVLALAGWAGLAFVQLIFKQPLLQGADNPAATTHRHLLGAFAALAGLLQLGVGAVLAQLLFNWAVVPAAGLLLALAGVALALAAWVRTAAVAPNWVRWQQLILAQLFVVAAVLGLHEAGLVWSAVLLVLYAENLLVLLLLAGRDETDLLHQRVYRVAVAGALLVGGALLLEAVGHLPYGRPAVLYREALLLALAGWGSIAFGQLAFKMPLLQSVKPYLLNRLIAFQLVSSHEEHRNWLGGFAGLGGLLQVGAGALVVQALFSWEGVPVPLLLLALLALAGTAAALAIWVRTAGRVPNWVRWQQLVLAQLFVVSAILGLHEAGLGWPAVLAILYAENLLVVLLLAGRDETDRLHRGLYRVAVGSTLAVGGWLLLLALGRLPVSTPAGLYRDALLLALAGWGSLVALQLAFKNPLLPGVKPYLTEPLAAPQLVSNHEAHRSWLGNLAVLAGLLQMGAGVLLSWALFNWEGVPVAWLLLALLALAGAAVALAAWVRTAAVVPNWVRWQQLILAQLFGLLAIVGLHELGLSWPIIWLLVYVESLLVVLLLAGRDEADLIHRGVYRAAAAGALVAGTTLLLLALVHFIGHRPPTLYRDALLLALAGWGSVAAVQFAFKNPLLPAVKPYLLPGSSFAPVSNPLTHRALLGSFGGLGGALQVAAGLLLARVVVAWVGVPVAGLLAALLGLAGAALALAAWLQATALAPDWLRRQQLVLGQFFLVLAGLGLHELGLGWPAVLLVLYAENLLVAALLSGRNEDILLRIQTYLLVLQATLLPLLVRYLSPGAPGSTGRATLLLGAALLTVAYQARRLFGKFSEDEYATLRLNDSYQLPLLGLLTGWLLLGAGSLVYAQPWAAWVLVAVVGALLHLRQRAAVPGLWAGLALAAFGYVLLQWSHVAGHYQHQAGYVLLYLLPTVAVLLVGLWVSWWPVGQRFVRWPWLYLLGLHLVVALVAAVPAHHAGLLALGLLALTGIAFAAAQAWRRTLPDATAVARAGQPDRYLLHLTYALLGAGLLAHLSLLAAAENFFGQPAEYFTAAAFFLVAAAITIGRPPATEPLYKSWQLLHRWLPEATLLFGTLTLAHNLRNPWLPLLWVSVALVINQVAARLPVHFRRLGVYGRLYYELAALTASLDCLLGVQPNQLLHPEWWALTAAVALLFVYVALALRVGNAPFALLSPAWAALAHPTRRQFEAALLYPAFLALSLLLIQSFDRSVLTVLLMLEVVAVFSTSLLLRRQDLRYVALAGMLGCLVRLVFFDLSRSGTITRAIVFIFMGLLLLGMNALYARFKARFAPNEEVGEEVPES